MKRASALLPVSSPAVILNQNVETVRGFPEIEQDLLVRTRNVFPAIL